MNEIFSRIYSELKAVPITMMFLAGVYIAVGVLWNDHVSQRDFRELKAQLVGVQFTLQHDHLDTRLHTVETELFNLNQHVLDEVAKNHAVDTLYFQRIDELKNQHAELVRQLSEVRLVGQ